MTISFLQNVTSDVWTPGHLRKIYQTVQTNEVTGWPTKARPLNNNALQSIARGFGQLPAFGGNPVEVMTWLMQRAEEDAWIPFNNEADNISSRVGSGLNAKDALAYLEMQYLFPRGAYWQKTTIGRSSSGSHPENALFNFTVPIPLYGWKLAQGISYETWRSNTDVSNLESLTNLDLLVGNQLGSTGVDSVGSVSLRAKRGITSISLEEINSLVEPVRARMREVIEAFQKAIYVPHNKISYWYMAKQVKSIEIDGVDPEILVSLIEFYNSLDYPARSRFASGGFFYYRSVSDYSLGKFTNWDDPGKQAITTIPSLARTSNLSGLSFMRRGQ